MSSIKNNISPPDFGYFAVTKSNDNSAFGSKPRVYIRKKIAPKINPTINTIQVTPTVQDSVVKKNIQNGQSILPVVKVPQVELNSPVQKIVKFEIDDHNYSDSKLNANNPQSLSISKSKTDSLPSQLAQLEKNNSTGLKIKNLNELKKKAIQMQSSAGSSIPVSKKNLEVPEEVTKKLDQYCRGCAGVKVPLVDIFSDRGAQMRLNQQMRHLGDIDKNDELSTNLCMDCICDLKMSYRFFMQIKKAEIKLKSICESLLNLKSLPDEDNISDLKWNEEDSHLYEDTAPEGASDDNFDNKDFVPYDLEPSINISDENDSFEEFECKFSSDLSDEKEVAYSNEEMNVDVQSGSDTTCAKSSETHEETNCEKIITSSNNKFIMPISMDENFKDSKQNQKRNVDLKDIKIPKLNLNDPSLRQDDQGIMYVTTQGSNPNEMLLIKVKKMDKTEKKREQQQKLTLKHEDNFNNVVDKNIDMQIEQYKKKRVEILGVRANVPEDATVVEEVMASSKTESNNGSQSEAFIARLQEINREIKRKHDVLQQGLAEDSTRRLRKVLKQNKEIVAEFAAHLKQRRIVASRVSDDDLISMFEYKYNVKLDKSALADSETDSVVETEDCEKFDCDFCFKSFNSLEMSLEHSKIHDTRFMYFCEDCGGEFPSSVKRREHNPGCIQKLICKICGDVLESKGKKRLHEQKHCDEENGQICEICGATFKHHGTLEQHIRGRHTHHENIFKCPQCPKEFPLKTKMNFHLKTVHTTVRAFLCEDCGKDFKNPASLRHHKVCKHLDSGNKKPCSDCHKLVPAYSMSKHRSTHKSYTIKCPHCEKMFKNTSTLKQHTRIHEDQRQYKCDICGVGFNRRDGLKLHMRVHMKKDSRGLKECACQVCGEKFPSHSTLVIHRNRTHKDGRTYTCHICNRSMISKRSLEWHLSNIHNEKLSGENELQSCIDEETKRVTCNHCNKTFKTETILRTHIKNSHTQKAPIKCEICDTVFMSDVRMKHHMMTEHERLEGTEKCPHCPKRFVNLLRLKTHMIAHSNERPFACDQCDFMLKTRIQLIKHKQNRHSDERPLQCKYCSWRCKQVSALVCHERTHTNERPYSCSVCKQRFKYLGDKNKHERRHESLGGSGFKRIITGRNNKPKAETSEFEDCNVNQDSSGEDQDDAKVDIFDETRIVKFETGEIVAESEATFEPIYVQQSINTKNETEVIVKTGDTMEYTEEVTTGRIEQEIITSEVIGDQMLQPGTVVHLQQQDSSGKIQVIPVMLSLPDLSETANDVGII